MKIRTKFMTAILSAACLTAGAAAFSACGSAHEHVYGDWRADGENGKHFRFCEECGAGTEYADHTDGDGNGICDDCGFVTDRIAAYHYTQSGFCYGKIGDGENAYLSLERIEKPARKDLVDVVIPSEVNGLPVKQVSSGIFQECTTLRSITLPEGITRIGSYAFSGCVNLEKITIPTSVKEIDLYAFRGCVSLENITLREGLTKIGGNVFDYCDKLKEIEIPASVTSMGAFNSGAALEKITVAAGNEKYYSADGVLYEKGKTKILVAPKCVKGEITIPSGITEIGTQFLRNKYITAVSIPDSVTSIAGYAFSGCVRLSEIVLPDGLTELKGNVFQDCVNLHKITLGSGLNNISSSAFSGCTKLIEVCNRSQLEYKNSQFKTSVRNIYTPTEGESRLKTTEDGNYIYYETDASDIAYLMKYIGEDANVTVPEKLGGRRYTVYHYAFAYNDNVKSVSFPATADSFFYFTFTGCDNLTELKLQDNDLYIGRNNCIIDKITGTIVAACKTSVMPAGGDVRAIADWAYSGCDWLTKLTVPEGVYTLYAGAFENCANLKNISLPSTLNIIQQDVFNGCTALESITVAADNPKYFSKDGILYNKETNETVCVPKAIKGEIDIPDGVTKISSYAFSGCTGITSVTVPDSVTTIGTGAFIHCYNLNNVKLGNGIKVLSDSLFDNCHNLREIEIPQSVEIIGRGAFFGCDGLTSVTIPNGVKNIGEGIFDYCLRLAEIYNLSSVAVTAGAAGYENVKVVHTSAQAASRVHKSDDFVFYDDGGSVSLIACFAEGSTIVLPDTFEGKNYKIDGYAFIRCGNERVGLEGLYTINNIVIPAGVTAFNPFAFQNCELCLVFYGGNISGWNSLIQGESGEAFAHSNFRGYYIFSNSKPTAEMYDTGNLFWNKNSNGEIVVWW